MNRKLLNRLVIALFLIVSGFALQPVAHAQVSDGPSISLQGASISEIYPNPATTPLVHFNYRVEGTAQQVSVEVFNLIGEVVWKQPVAQSSGTMHINIASFKKGVYFYRLQVGEEKTPIKKLIVR